MSQEHGDAFTLLRQKQPTFQRTKGGGFDTGFRRFRCHQEDAKTLLFKYFRPGVKDSALVQVATGGTLAGYPQMFVSHAGIEQEEGDRATVRVELEGLLFGKNGSVVFSTASHEQSAVGSLDGYTISRVSHLHVPVPTVTHTWVATRGRPSAVLVGSAITPPGITSTETALAGQYHSDFADGLVTLFEGWILANRTMRAPGDVISSPVWEVVDVYQFEVSRVAGTPV